MINDAEELAVNTPPTSSREPFVGASGTINSETSAGSNPFASDADSTAFYEGAERAQQLDAALHLAQFGNNIALIAGDKGVGKTFLLEQACCELAETANCCFISALACPDDAAIAAAIVNALVLG